MSQTQCAWCSPTLDPNASHGICRSCAGEVEARTWQPRYEREIAEAVGRAELASRADEQRQAWASAQNLGRQRASAQNGADFDETTRGDVWYRRVGVAMCVISAAFVAYLAWQIVRWVL